MINRQENTAGPIGRGPQALCDPMSSTFHNASIRTHQRIVLTGLLFCAAFVFISMFAGERSGNNHVRLDADRLVQAAAVPLPAI